MTVPAGASSATIPVRTVGVAVTTAVTVSLTTPIGGIKTSFTLLPAQVRTISLPAAATIGGSAATGTITLNGAAPPASPVTVVLALSAADHAAIPASIAVPAGASSVSFPIQTQPTDIAVSPVVTASVSKESPVSAMLRVRPPLLTALRFAPAEVAAGSSTTGTVSLDGKAPPAGVVVRFTVENAPGLVAPRDLTISPGAMQSSFVLPVAASASTAQATVTALGTITGSSGTVASGSTTSLLVLQALAVQSISVDEPTVVGGHRNPTATIVLTGPAPSGGTTLLVAPRGTGLTMTGGAAAASVVVPAGTDRVRVPLTSVEVGQLQRVVLGAVPQAPTGATTTVSPSIAAAPNEAVLTVVPRPAVLTLSAIQPTVVGGQQTFLTVTFAPLILPVGVTPASFTFSASSSHPTLATTAPVTIPIGRTLASLTVKTTATSEDVRATLTVTMDGKPLPSAVAGTTVLVTAPVPRVTAMLAARTTLAPGDSVPVTVTLDRPASRTGLTVLLTSSAPLALAVPSSISIPAGVTSTTFLARVQPTVTAATTVSIRTPANPRPNGDVVVDGATNTIIQGEEISTGPLAIVPLRLSGVSLVPRAAFGGEGDVELTVRLFAPVSVAQTVLLRVTQDASVAGSIQCPVPTSVTVPAGSAEARLRFRTAPVTTPASITCTVFAELAQVPSTSGSANASLLVHPVPAIVDITPSPAEVTGGQPHFAQVRFTAVGIQPISSGVTTSIPLTITSNNAAVQGTTVQVPLGTTEMRYGLNTTPVAARTVVRLTYALGTGSVTRDLVVLPPPPQITALTLDQSRVIGGDTVTATATLDRPVLSVPLELAVNSSSPAAVAPAGVLIPVGASQATVRVATVRVGQPQSVVLSARLSTGTNPTVIFNDGSVRTITTTLTPSGTLTVEPLSVRQLLIDQPVGFGSVQRPSVTLVLGARAPSGGAKLVLASSLPGVISASGVALPLVITVPGGADRVTVALRTPQVPQLTDVILSALPAPDGSVDGHTTATLDVAAPQVRTTQMQLLPVPILTNLRLEPASVVGGTGVVMLGDLTNSVRSTLTTTTPPTLSMVVNSSSPEIVPSGTVTVRPGDTTVRLERTTTAVTVETTVRFTVTLVVTRLSATLLVRAP